MATIDEALVKLQKSAFRAKFHLTEKDKQYVKNKGMDTVREHAADFVRQRLAPAVIPNDGKQTPMRGHPVFIAQHACACCCRGCLNKEQFIDILPNLSQYLLIPHMDKNPNVDMYTLSMLGDYISCGEVGSIKKFVYFQKRRKNADTGILQRLSAN